MLAWVHATLVESQLISYQLFVGDLSAKMRDAYCAEAAQVGPSLGIPEGVLPHTESELRRYLDRMLTSGAIEVTDTARGLARLLLQPTGLFLRWALAPGRLVTAALLPETLRDAYGLPWNRGRQQRFRWLIRAIRAMHALIPQFLREWPVARK